MEGYAHTNCLHADTSMRGWLLATAGDLVDLADAPVGRERAEHVDVGDHRPALPHLRGHAHFPARESLVNAVLDKLTDETLAAIDAADLDDGPAAAALIRFLDANWQTFERYPVLLNGALTHSFSGLRTK